MASPPFFEKRASKIGSNRGWRNNSRFHSGFHLLHSSAFYRYSTADTTAMAFPFTYVVLLSLFIGAAWGFYTSLFMQYRFEWRSVVGFCAGP